MKNINLEKNIQLCFKSGFGTLITASTDGDFRNAIISIHDGLELLMKYYLKRKDECLIYEKITYKTILHKRNDLIKIEKLKHSKTISYMKCISILEYFSELPKKNSKYLNQLHYKRNSCVHFEYSYDEKEFRKLLISHIYEFICGLISEMGLVLNTFIPESNLISLNNYKKDIDDEVKQDYYAKIESARKHYFNELTQLEQKQKAETEDYTKGGFDKIVKCPACEKNSLLRRKIQRTQELLSEDYIIMKRELILRDLSCYYCGLTITDYDQMKLEFKDEEKSLRKAIYHHYPDDCPEYDDCPEPPEDCYGNDCPEPSEDLYDRDCPDDC